MIFHDKWVLLLIPVVIACILFLNRKISGDAGLKFSSGELLKGLRRNLKVRLRDKLIFFRIIIKSKFFVSFGIKKTKLNRSNARFIAPNIIIQDSI